MRTGILIFLTLYLTNIYTANSNSHININSSLPENSDTIILIIRETEAEIPEESSDIWLPSPARAAMLSATFPGLGQIYNRKYWKVPIIFAGFGVLAYFLDFNNSYYQIFRKAYYYRVDGNPHTVDDYPYASTDNLRRGMNYYRRNLEVTYLLTAALYILNILDASVDAHLMDFDLSEDLTLRMEPVIEKFNNISNISAGLKLTVRF